MVAFAWALLDGYNDRLLPLQSVPRHYAVCRGTSSAQTDSTFVLCLLVVFIGIPRFGAPNREWIQRTLSPRCGLVISPPPTDRHSAFGIRASCAEQHAGVLRTWRTNEKGIDSSNAIHPPGTTILQSPA